MRLSKSEHAVSPIIGTILLVAIAVVLAAIILVVVMGFSGDANEKKVGLNVQSSAGSNATLLLYGGESMSDLIRLEMIDLDSPSGKYVEVWNSSDGELIIGYPYSTKEDVAEPGKSMDVYDTRINVRGTFSDGTEVILLIQPVTFKDVYVPQGIFQYIDKVEYNRYSWTYTPTSGSPTFHPGYDIDITEHAGTTVTGFDFGRRTFNGQGFGGAKSPTAAFIYDGITVTFSSSEIPKDFGITVTSEDNKKLSSISSETSSGNPVIWKPTRSIGYGSTSTTNSEWEVTITAGGFSETWTLSGTNLLPTTASNYPYSVAI